MSSLLIALALFSGVISAAPTAVLTYDSPTVATVAAPVVVRPAPAEVRVPAKIARPVATHKTVTTPAPAIDPYSGNPIVDCAAQGLIRAEDYSCVPATFYPTVGTDAPFTFPPCDDEDDQVLVKGVPVAACHWDAQKQGNGTGTSFTKFSK